MILKKLVMMIRKVHMAEADWRFIFYVRMPIGILDVAVRIQRSLSAVMIYNIIRC